VDIQASFNIFPRNANDTKTNLQVILEVHKLNFEYSNDLTRNILNTALIFLQTLSLKILNGLVISPDMKALQKKMRFYSKMALIKSNFVDQILNFVHERRSKQSVDEM